MILLCLDKRPDTKLTQIPGTKPNGGFATAPWFKWLWYRGADRKRYVRIEHTPHKKQSLTDSSKPRTLGIAVGDHAWYQVR